MSNNNQHQVLQEDNSTNDDNNKIESSQSTIKKEELKMKNLNEINLQVNKEIGQSSNKLGNKENNLNKINQNKMEGFNNNQNVNLNDIDFGTPDPEKSNQNQSNNSKEENTDSNEEGGFQSTIHKKIAGGLLGSVRNSALKGLDTCLYSIPKKGQVYFNVTSEIILQRLKQGVNPYNNTLLDSVKDSPDLYGPFWIYTSVVFCLAASGSLYQYIHNYSKTNLTSFAQFVSTSSFWIYLIGFTFPLIITLLLKYTSKSSINYMTALCIYGYTFAIFIPISIISVFFSSFIDWVLMLYAAASSSYILIKSFSHYFFNTEGYSVTNNDKNKKYTILGVIVIFQLLLIWFMSAYFFTAPSNPSPKKYNNDTNNKSNNQATSSSSSSMEIEQSTNSTSKLSNSEFDNLKKSFEENNKNEINPDNTNLKSNNTNETQENKEIVNSDESQIQQENNIKENKKSEN